MIKRALGAILSHHHLCDAIPIEVKLLDVRSRFVRMNKNPWDIPEFMPTGQTLLMVRFPTLGPSSVLGCLPFPEAHSKSRIFWHQPGLPMVTFTDTTNPGKPMMEKNGAGVMVQRVTTMKSGAARRELNVDVPKGPSQPAPRRQGDAYVGKAVCLSYVQHGTCDRGNTCKFVHVHELRLDREQCEKIQCTHYGKGNCSNPTCKFKHGDHWPMVAGKNQASSAVGGGGRKRASHGGKIFTNFSPPSRGGGGSSSRQDRDRPPEATKNGWNKTGLVGQQRAENRRAEPRPSPLSTKRVFEVNPEGSHTVYPEGSMGLGGGTYSIARKGKGRWSDRPDGSDTDDDDLPPLEASIEKVKSARSKGRSSPSSPRVEEDAAEFLADTEHIGGASSSAGVKEALAAYGAGQLRDENGTVFGEETDDVQEAMDADDADDCLSEQYGTPAPAAPAKA